MTFTLIATMLSMMAASPVPAEAVEVSPCDVAVAEGAYVVTVDLDGGADGSTVFVTGEARRALLGPIELKPGERTQQTFAVWRMSPDLGDGRQIKRTDREIGSRTYDDRLTLEVLGTDPRLLGVSVEPAKDVTTIFLAGDSTVADQSGVPWSAWGAMLPRYFDENVAVANLASSGRALRSFRAEWRLDKLLSLMNEGDYVMIQFGHNDMKETGEGVGPFESYTRDLEQYVDAIREHGGRPILVTSMVRRRFDRDGKWYDTLGDYPEAVRRVAVAKEVPLIDLFATSRTIVESLGEESSKHVYVHYPAGTFPGQNERLKDDTHFNTYGADLMARAVIVGLKEAVPELAEHLRDPSAGVDPSNPEEYADWYWPEVPPEATMGSDETPEGS